MKGTFEFDLNDGRKCRITAEVYRSMKKSTLFIDGFPVENEAEPKYVNSIMVAYVDGKKVDSCDNPYFWKLIDIKDNVKKIWGMNIAFTDMSEAEKYTEWLDNLINTGTSDEVKEFKKAKEEKERTEGIEAAKRCIKEAEQQSCIPTKEEMEIMLENYNNLHNEGGEGYLPTIICKEQYEAAKNYLEKNK